MTGNIALDVAIGLVFVFVLYSLLASIIAEIIASFFGLRARNLRTGIARILDEDRKGLIRSSPRDFLIVNKFIDYVNDIISSVGSFIRKQDNTSAVAQFYKHPSIKYLAKNKFFSKPSYIPPSTFSKVVMDKLKENGKGETNLEKIQSALEKFHKITKKIESLEKKLLANPEERNAIKKEIQELKDSAFLHGDTYELVKSYLDDAYNDLDKFQESLEHWFNSTMERAAGWYKRKNQFILLCIGLFIASMFNVNTIEITRRLAKDDQARTEMVALASNFVEENPDLVNRINQFQNDSLDSNLRGDVQAINDRIDTLLSIKEDLQGDIDNANRVLGLSVPDSLWAEYVPKSERKQRADSLLPNQWFVNDSFYIVTFSDPYMAKHAGPYFRVCEKDLKKKQNAWAYRCKGSYWWHNLLGYLITALAISLGAPFWFDLLNKLVKLRSSVRQDPGSSGSGGSGQGTPPPKPTEKPVG